VVEEERTRGFGMVMDDEHSKEERLIAEAEMDSGVSDKIVLIWHHTPLSSD
jgi:hypothetical protein